MAANRIRADNGDNGGTGAAKPRVGRLLGLPAAHGRRRCAGVAATCLLLTVSGACSTAPNVSPALSELPGSWNQCLSVRYWRWPDGEVIDDVSRQVRLWVVPDWRDCQPEPVQDADELERALSESLVIDLFGPSGETIETIEATTEVDAPEVCVDLDPDSDYTGPSCWLDRVLHEAYVSLPDDIEFASVRVLSRGSRELAIGAETIAENHRSEPPSVELTAPEPGAVHDGDIELRWTMLDPDSDRLYYALFYSAGGDAYQRLDYETTVLNDEPHHDEVYTTSPPAGADEVRFIVMVSDGINWTWTESPAVAITPL